MKIIVNIVLTALLCVSQLATSIYSYRVLFILVNAGDQFENLVVNIRLKLILRKYCGTLLNGFSWFRIRYNGLLF